MRSSRSTTCSTGSCGSWRDSSCAPSACAGTSRRATISSSASACCSRSWSPGCRATTHTDSCSAARYARGTRSSTSASSSAPMTRSLAASTSIPSSTSARTRATPTRSSAACKHSPRRSQFMPEGATHLASGKVREIYSLGDDRLLLVASDRISTFDVVLPTEIPDKGRVLTGLSGFWFTLLHEIVPNHMLAIRDDGRSMESRRLQMLPVEAIVRGYITGSGWKDYQATGSTSGHVLAGGLRESDKLPQPIFTPSTKAETGHDENISREQAADLLGIERMREVEEVAIALYTTAADYARPQGLIIADTKFEFGLDQHGALVLGDEALTPDSSRFWPADDYEPGRAQTSFDKQYVRDFVETTGWDKTYPGPQLPEDVVMHTRSKYIEAFEV